VAAHDGRLSVRGPKGAAGLVRLILEHKAGILDMLGAESLVDESAPVQPPESDESTASTWPPRPEELAKWSLAWRERWGRLANELEDSGVPWPECERQAFDRMKEAGAQESPSRRSLPRRRSMNAPARSASTPVVASPSLIDAVAACQRLGFNLAVHWSSRSGKEWVVVRDATNAGRRPPRWITAALRARERVTAGYLRRIRSLLFPSDATRADHELALSCAVADYRRLRGV
jgi:hypothetical protein